MQTKKTDTSKSEKAVAMAGKTWTVLKSETTSFIIGLLCVIFGVYMLLAFSSFFFTGGNDQSILTHPNPSELLETGNRIQNYAGARGAQLAQFLINDCFGFSAYCIIIFLVVAGMKLMKAYQFRIRNWFLGCATVMIWFSVTLGFAFGGVMEDSFIYPGGLHGYNVSRWICSQIGTPGLILVLLAVAILFGVALTQQTMGVVRKALHPSLKKGESIADAGTSQPDTASRQEEVKAETVTAPLTDPEEEKKEKKESFWKSWTHRKQKEDKKENEAGKKEEPAAETKEETEPAPVKETKKETPVAPPKEETSHAIDLPIEPEGKEEAHPFEVEPVRKEEEKEEEPAFEVSNDTKEEDQAYKGDITQPYNPRLDLEFYRFPTLDLLNTYQNEDPDIDMEEQNTNKNRIIKVLRSFGIEISSIKASVGPTITLYEITPAEGVRISKIRNLEDDIALSLSALGIRIIAPIPGKGTIGIEVPNANPHIVPMSSILTSKKFQETTFDLPVALGKTITNEVFMVDLAKAPHMLVAGATGQGKSVGLNAIVTSLLYKKHPSELKFVIIDPKKVEFAIYAPIERHFLAKLPDGDDAIITDVTKVVQTLNSLCVEMDNRYKLLQSAGCRNIKEYNAKFINRQLNPENGHHFLPYIVIIIDEFGDLIMTAGKEVELPICRIAQLARAVGIHAIIATQRPTTNIITGTIKANFPARVAFRVASMMDSRTILDRPGAQQLIGKGDMLYLQGNDPVRVQCAFVDTPEVERIAAFIGKQQGYPTAFMLPEYVDENAEASGSTADVDMNRLDPLFEEAARLVIYHQQGSTSLIQRKFSIGYNRAGRIMDQLEKAGIVGPANGSKARDVLCLDENDLQMRMSSLKD